MKVHQAVARALIDNGIDTLFGLIGDANLFMVRCFAQEQGGRFIASNNEAGATLMAIGYSTTTGKPGVVSVTHGPGMTNALTALVEAAKAQVPLLFLCGDTPASDPAHFQNVSQREFLLASGAGFEQLRSPETLLQDFANALRRAVIERRPVALNMPADFEWEDVEYQAVVPALPNYKPGMQHSAELDNAVGIIAAARSPIILAGRGAVSPEAEAALCKLAKRSGALLATTLKARGLFSDEAFNLGVFGTLSTPAAAELIMQSDCVIAFGASLNKFTSGKGSYLDGKRIIQCNLERAWVGDSVAPDAGLIGDPTHIAETLVYWLDEADIPASGFRNDDVRQRLATQDPFADLPDTSTAISVDLTRSLLRINAVVPRDRVFVCDVGRYVGQAWKTIDVAHPSAYVHTVHFGSIGLGVSCGIGAGVAYPGRPILVVTGDGGFMLGGLAEFHTAVRYDVRLIIVVCNDSGYGAEYVQYEARSLDPALSLFEWPDFAELARSLGGSGVCVRTPDDLEEACAAIAALDGPLLIDLKLDPANMIPLDY
ncbi:MAG: thiamine pyrophosphate-binding protein [Congregibacter sp.]